MREVVNRSIWYDLPRSTKTAIKIIFVIHFVRDSMFGKLLLFFNRHSRHTEHFFLSKFFLLIQHNFSLSFSHSLSFRNNTLNLTMIHSIIFASTYNFLSNNFRISLSFFFPFICFTTPRGQTSYRTEHHHPINGRWVGELSLVYSQNIPLSPPVRHTIWALII